MLIRSDLDEYQSQLSLLGDLVQPEEDLDASAYRILKQRTGLDDLYLEQVQTFGKVNRHPAGRVVTVAYCSLINIQHHRIKILDNDYTGTILKALPKWHLIIKPYLKDVTRGCKKECRSIPWDLACCQVNFLYGNYKTFTKPF